MTKIINKIEGARIYELNKFHSMLADDYLYNIDNEQTNFIFEQFFRDSDRAKAKKRLMLLNMSYSLPSLVAEKFADYVGQPKTDFEGFDIDNFVTSFIWGGYSVFIPRVKEGVFKIEYASPDEYILEDDGTERLLTFYEIPNANDEISYYILEQVYAKETIVRTLYKVSSFPTNNKFALDGTIIPLNSIPPTAELLPFENLPAGTLNGLIKVHNRKLNSLKYGTSELRKIRSLISSIEIEAVNIQDQFLKHLQAKLALPKSAMKIDDEGQLNIRNLEAYGIETGDTLPQFIVNSNPLIDKAFNHIEDLLRQICAILTIPTEFMGLKDGGSAESADTKKIRLVSFIKKVEKIREKFTQALKELNRIRLLWTREGSENLTISWPDIFPTDTSALVTELSTAQDARLISNVKAIMKYNNMSEEEALAEQKIINEEKSNFDTSLIENNPQAPQDNQNENINNGDQTQNNNQ